MNQHQGQVLEYIVRKKGYNISELALKMGVNRRSVYNWFNRRYIKKDLLAKLGSVLQHDFSAERSDMHHPIDLVELPEKQSQVLAEGQDWKSRYIKLLEDYHQMLKNQVVRSTETQSVA